MGEISLGTWENWQILRLIGTETRRCHRSHNQHGPCPTHASIVTVSRGHSKPFQQGACTLVSIERFPHADLHAKSNVEGKL